MRHEIALLRLIAQHIAGPKLGSAVEAVRWLTAMQAQDYSAAVTAIALRTEAGTRATVEAAINCGEIVRSWPMRGTLHFVAAEDLSWMLSLTAERTIAGAATRRANLGLDMAIFDKAQQLAVDAFASAKQLNRTDLLAVWNDAGLLTVNQRGYHLIWHLAHTGVLCYGPVYDGEQHFVLVDEWIAKPRNLGRDEALGEWALRYFRSHGPATVKDFAWWTKLVSADVKTAMAIARPQLEHMQVEGVEYFLAPETPDALEAWRNQARDTFLLPAFDEYIIGYQNRDAALPSEFAPRIIPGNNGIFQPVVVSGGQVIGTWKRVGQGKNRRIESVPFTSFSAKTTAEIHREYAKLP